MEKSCKSALDPFGRAILAYWQGNESAELIHEFKTGQKKVLPVSVFFRSPGELLATEKAFEYCHGKILVVGAGTGVHAIELEKQGFGVTAIDICPQAVQIMKARGIKGARQQDFFQFEDQGFDTIFMLGHNIGICKTLKGIKGLFSRCRRLLRPGGQLLVNSIKEPGSVNGPGHKGYPGELEFRLSHDGITGPWMRWLHLDFETLEIHALKYGWFVEKLAGTGEGGFLARLNPEG